MKDYLDIVDDSGDGDPRIRQGIGVIVFAPTLEHVYLSLRHGGGEFNGFWQNPGVKLEVGEAPNAGAARGLFEETGLRRTFLLNRLFLTTLGKNSRGHYLFHWFFTVLREEETLKRMEPDQNTPWEPYSISMLKQMPLMPFLHKAVLVAHAIVKGDCER